MTSILSHMKFVFVQLYLQKRLQTSSIVAKSVLQFVLIALAWFTALSRVTDNKHHWSDVLVGILIGSSVAIINVSYLQWCVSSIIDLINRGK